MQKRKSGESNKKKLLVRKSIQTTPYSMFGTEQSQVNGCTQLKAAALEDAVKGGAIMSWQSLASDAIHVL